MRPGAGVHSGCSLKVHKMYYEYHLGLFCSVETGKKQTILYTPHG